MNDEYQVLVSDFEIETGANFKEWLKDSGFKQIVDNFNSADDDLGLFNTRELLIDYVTIEGKMMTKLERLHEWVHNNFWKYQAITKIPLIVIVIVVFLIIKETT